VSSSQKLDVVHIGAVVSSLHFAKYGDRSSVGDKANEATCGVFDFIPVP